MMAFLNNSGWVPVEDSEGADLIIINSCGFIESAKQESINAVLAYRKIYPHKKILLAGCLAQRYASELSASLPEADLLFGNADLSRVSAAASAALGADPARGAATGAGFAVPDADPAVDTGGPSLWEDSRTAVPALMGNRPLLSLPGSAYVKIAEGCNNRCSFCAIPLIRGSLRSRPIPHILDECRRLLDRGVRELCLIGQDLGSYGSDISRPGSSAGLPGLLEAMASLDGAFWVRFLYIHPDNFPRPILDICRRDPRFLPYFDIPFQHGSAPILRAMNRRGNAGAYLRLIDEIRSALPDSVIRSTFLTGFPGETDDDFEALLEFQDKARLDWAGAFAYSREEDTPAYVMKGRVSKRTAGERKARIEERQIPITEKQMDRFVGRTLEVLVEERMARPNTEETGPADIPEEELYLGRLFCQAPEVDGSALIHTDSPLAPGKLVRCRVFARAGFDLEVGV
jgi:ribosomal protein S12 methylthiotransferase